MTEFKEKLIFEIMDDLQDQILDMYQLGRGYLDGKRLRDVIRRTVMEKLDDVVIIDRKKFKEHLEVDDYPPYCGHDFSPHAMFAVRLCAKQFYDELTIDSVGIDAIKDRVKEAFIYKLEECDF